MRSMLNDDDDGPPFINASDQCTRVPSDQNDENQDSEDCVDDDDINAQ